MDPSTTNLGRSDSAVVSLANRSYRIDIGSQLLPHVGTIVATCAAHARVAIITDENVGPIYAEAVSESLEQSRLECRIVTIPAGEASKSLQQAARIYEHLADFGLQRDGIILALGGGVVGDLAGFVAATWMRGVAFVQCPTTTEAAFDAAVGGKSALNLPAGKNRVGVFHQPRAVLIDVDTFSTLDARDFRAGLAESVKHALIEGDDLLDWHERSAAAILARDPAALIQLVRRNCEIKARVVAADERETGGADGIGRAVLNLGHTFGHALESAYNYAYRHGECIALGLLAVLRLGAALGVTDTALPERARALLASFGLPTQLPAPIDVAAVRSFLNTDKKAASGRVRFVVIERPGRLRWLEAVPPAAIDNALASLS